MEARRFGLDVMVHERLPFVVEGHATEVQQGLGAGQGPVHLGPFHPILDDVAAGAFDHAGGDGIAGGEVLIVVDAVAVAVEIAVNPFQPGAGGGGQMTLLGQVLQPADHAGAHPAQQPQDQQFHPLQRHGAAGIVKEMHRLPQITGGVQQVEDFHPRRGAQGCGGGIPQ